MTIGPRVMILAPQGLVLGDRAGVARDALLDARAGLEIGEEAMVGFESAIVTWTHRFDDPNLPPSKQGFVAKPTRIGAGAWVGMRATILPGRDVGENAIVGASAIVTQPVAPGSIVAGNPARELRKR